MSENNMKKDKTSNEKKKQSHKIKEKTEKIIKDIYFIILYTSKQQEKSDEFTFSENDPEVFYHISGLISLPRSHRLLLY